MSISISAVQTICSSWVNQLGNIASDNSLCVYTCKSINTSLLSEKYIREDIRNSEDFEYLFQNLDKKTYAIYVFEIESDHDSASVKAAFEAYRNQPGHRVCPPLNATNDSSVLYVGKVSASPLWGRVIYHLGVGILPDGHGLQLLHWAKNLEIILKLHIFEFEKSIIDDILIEALEQSLAKKLKPLIGKH